MTESFCSLTNISWFSPPLAAIILYYFMSLNSLDYKCEMVQSVWASLVTQLVKNLPAMGETWV